MNIKKNLLIPLVFLILAALSDTEIKFDYRLHIEPFDQLLSELSNYPKLTEQQIQDVLSRMGTLYGVDLVTPSTGKGELLSIVTRTQSGTEFVFSDMSTMYRLIITDEKRENPSVMLSIPPHTTDSTSIGNPYSDYMRTNESDPVRSVFITYKKNAAGKNLSEDSLTTELITKVIFELNNDSIVQREEKRFITYYHFPLKEGGTI